MAERQHNDVVKDIIRRTAMSQIVNIRKHKIFGTMCICVQGGISFLADVFWEEEIQKSFGEGYFLL